MKITDILKEDGDTSGDYQKMQAFVNANRVGGVPADQQVALALFKEIQKQRQQNQALSTELSDAEKRINQALGAGELSKRELGMHRTELDRERAAGEKQQTAIGQMGQQYSEREKASSEQMSQLTDQLNAIKSKPGVDQKAAEQLETQIKQLSKNSVSASKLSELEAHIATVQDMQRVDDTVIKDLVAQINSAQEASQELEKTKSSLKKDVDSATQDALDAVAQMKQDLVRLNQVTDKVQLYSTNVIPGQIDNINQKIAELDAENEDQYADLNKHEEWLKTVAPNAEPSDTGALAQARGQFNLPTAPVNNQQDVPVTNTAPAPAPVNPAAAAIARQAAQQKAKLGQSFGVDAQEPEPIAESAFNRSIRWATGKTK